MSLSRFFVLGLLLPSVTRCFDGEQMPAFQEVRRVHHTADEMFDLVADVERYHEFVPLCLTLLWQIFRGHGIPKSLFL